MGEEGVSRRDALKATGGILSGLAIGTAAEARPAVTQSTVYAYNAMRVQLVDAASQPPRFLAVRSPVYLTRDVLADCNTDHPCSLDVLAYRGFDDDDDDDDDGGRCPGFASIVLLCRAQAPSEAVVVTGLVPDVLGEYADRGYDFVVRISPSNATNVTSPETVANPCPTRAGDDRDDDDDDQDDQADDDTDDTNGDDTDDDDGRGDDNGDGSDDDDANDDDGGGDDGNDD